MESEPVTSIRTFVLLAAAVALPPSAGVDGGTSAAAASVGAHTRRGRVAVPDPARRAARAACPGPLKAGERSRSGDVGAAVRTEIPG